MVDILTLLEEIQAIARAGLYYSEEPYDQERYERLLALAAASYTDLLGLPDEVTKARFAAELGSITPKVGADAAIFNEQGEILLMERADGSGWCLPCGWVEANERPIDAAIREVREETGLEVRAKQLVGVFTRKASAANGPHAIVAGPCLKISCDNVGGDVCYSLGS